MHIQTLDSRSKAKFKYKHLLKINWNKLKVIVNAHNRKYWETDKNKALDALRLITGVLEKH
jgi:hypothetical protein